MKMILVCGGREYKDMKHMDRILLQLFADFPKACIIQGGARGADRLAKWFCTQRGLPCITFDAPWEFHGNYAGPIRNQWMLDYCKPDMVLAFDGGSGTRDMVQRSEACRIPTYKV